MSKKTKPNKPRYFYAMVPIWIRLDSAASNPYVTLNGALQFMEDGMGNIYASTTEVELSQLHKSIVPREIK